MIVFLNGRFVSEEAAFVPIGDRGLLYGDGLFETLRVVRGLPFQWDEHLARFARGAELLGILPPLSSGELRLAAARLVALNGKLDTVLRLTLTRGSGPRGYSPKGANTPTLVMTLHSAPKPGTMKLSRVRLITATIRVAAGDPLANIKSCNKLPHILARAEADAANADDALLLNNHGQLAEASASNLFWLSGTVLVTPPERVGALMGIARETVLRLAVTLGLQPCEVDDTPSVLRHATGVFLTNSVSGITEAVELDGHALARSPWTERIWKAYANLVEQSCRV